MPIGDVKLYTHLLFFLREKYIALYEMLGLSAIDGGEYVGWNCDDGLYWIDFNHRKTVLDDGLEVYVIEMVWTPDTNWCDEEDFTME